MLSFNKYYWFMDTCLTLSEVGVTAFAGEKSHQFRFSCEFGLISKGTSEKSSFILNC